MTSEPDHPEWPFPRLALEVPDPARRLATGHDVNMAVWLRNVGEDPVDVMTARALRATIRRGADVVAGPSGLRDSAHIRHLAPGAAVKYGLWLNAFTNMNSPSKGYLLPPGEYAYTGTLSCHLFRGRRSKGERPDGPLIELPTGPWPLTITDAEPA